MVTFPRGSVIYLLATSPTGIEEVDSDNDTAAEIAQMQAAIPGEITRQLSAAEQRVLGELVAGLSEKLIAAKLKNRPGTVHSHVKAIYRTLGVNSKGELQALILKKAVQ